jgi:Leucine-rich repeat (LRR) protein
MPVTAPNANYTTVPYYNFGMPSSPALSKPVVFNNQSVAAPGPTNAAMYGGSTNFNSTMYPVGTTSSPIAAVVNNQTVPTYLPGSVSSSRTNSLQPNYVVATNASWSSNMTTPPLATATSMSGATPNASRPTVPAYSYAYNTPQNSPTLAASSTTVPYSSAPSPTLPNYSPSTHTGSVSQPSPTLPNYSPSAHTGSVSQPSPTLPNYSPSAHTGSVSQATAFIMGKDPTATAATASSDASGRWRKMLKDPTTKTIDVSNQHLSELPSEVLSCTRLQVIKARYNKLSKLSHRVSNLAALTLLDLRGNTLHKLAEEVGTLQALQNLDLGQNELSEVPVALTGCTNLVTLLLDHNHLHSLSPAFSVLTKLQVLHINNNYLTSLTSEMMQFPALRELGLSSNRLSALPANFTQLHTLEWLDLSNNQLTALPSLRTFTQLHTLYAAHNAITCVPSDVSALVRLCHCQLQHNELSALPQEFWLLTNLVELELQENRLTELSPRVSQLQHLKRLNVSANQLDTLPYQLSLLPTLLAANGLDLRQNPLSTIPPEIVSQGTDAIVGFLRLVNSQSAPWRRIKLVFVGDEKVGKTSLLKVFAQHYSELSKERREALKRKNLSATGDTVATDGIDIEDWIPDNVETVATSLAKKSSATPASASNLTDITKFPLCFSCWDFAGQEVYYPTHQFFLTQRSIYLVVFNLMDVRASRVDYWLKVVKARANGAPCVVVGTHRDDKRCDKKYWTSVLQRLRAKYQARFPFIKDYVAVSCKTEKGIKELKNLLITLALSSPIMNQSVPLSYVLLEEHIRRLRQTQYTVTVREFEALAATAGIERSDDVRTALTFFNDVGVVTTYFTTAPRSSSTLSTSSSSTPNKSSPPAGSSSTSNSARSLDSKYSALNDLVILNPQWLADLLATIITLKHNCARDGILHEKDLPLLWKDYPPTMWESLLGLLERFEVVYRLKVRAQKPSSLSASPTSLKKGPKSPSSKSPRKLVHQLSLKDTTRVAHHKLSSSTEEEFAVQRPRQAPTKLHESNTKTPPLSRSDSKTTLSSSSSSSRSVSVSSSSSPSSSRSATVSSSTSTKVSSAMGVNATPVVVVEDTSKESSSSPQSKPPPQSSTSTPLSGTLIVPSLLPVTPDLTRFHALWPENYSDYIANPATTSIATADDSTSRSTTLSTSSEADATLFHSPVGRIYFFAFMPLGFMSRLIVRTLHLKGVRALYYWRHGMIVTSEHDEAQRGLVLYDESSVTLHLRVRFKGPVSGDLLFLLVENLNALIYTFFNTRPEIRIPCSHCLQLLESNASADINPCLFTLEECLLALRTPTQSLTCTTTSTTDNNSPDTITNVSSASSPSTKLTKKKFLPKFKQRKLRHLSTDGTESKTQTAAAADTTVTSSTAASANNTATSPTQSGREVEVKTTVALRDVAPDMTFAFHTNELTPAFTVFDFSQITLEEKVAEGGYAILHRGHVKASGMDPNRTYAIKVLRDQDGEAPDLLTNSFRELQHEVFMMASLRHDNIVELKGLCLKPLALIMDFFPLGSLDKHLRGSQNDSQSVETLSWPLRLRIATDICQGMLYLHSEDIVHRDLRSANVLLIDMNESAKVVAKVADMGMACVLAGLLHGGDFNENWTAPEVLLDKDYTEKCDVYSFGIILWELLQVGFPFMEYQKELSGISRIEFAQRVEAGLRPTIPKWCPEPYANLIRQCWETDAQLRPSFSEIAQTLRDFESLHAKWRLR